MDDYKTFIIKHPKLKELDPTNLPDDLKISTMTLTCKIPVNFNAGLIAKHIEISPNFIKKIKFGNHSEIFRQVTSTEKKKKKNYKKSNRNFFNQVSLLIKTDYISAKKKESVLNIKLFKNGSIQLTGCKSISYVIYILDKIFTMLKKPIKCEGSEIVEYFVTPIFFLNILDIYNLKIDMINSDFIIGFNIDRDKLFKVLNSDRNSLFDCVYDPSRHASVMIHYIHDEMHPKKKKKLITTILVFAKGKIIITGARNYMRLVECYKFINQYLIENYIKIVRIDN